MPFRAHAFLREHRDEIVEGWQRAARGAARTPSRTDAALRDRLPELLDEVAASLEPEGGGRGRRRGAAARRLAAGLESAHELTGVVRELHLLRAALLETVVRADAAEPGRPGSDGSADRATALAALNGALDAVVAEVVERFAAGQEARLDGARSLDAVLGRSEAFLRRVLDATPSMVFVKDTDGRFALANHAVAEIYGTTPAGLVGKTDADFDANADEVEHFRRDDLEVIETRREKLIGDEPVTGVDGRVRWFRTVKVPLVDPGGACDKVLGVATDITEQKRVEERLRAAELRLTQDLDAMTRLHRLSTRFVREDLAAVLGEVVDAAVAITRADQGNLQLLDPATGRLVIAAHRGHEPWWLEFFEGVDGGDAASCGAAMARKTRVIVEDVATSPIFAGTPALEVQRRAGIRAVQSTPLVGSSGELVGMISTHFRAPHRPDEQTLRLLDVLARQAAEMIERGRTEELARQSARSLQALANSMPQLAWTARPDGFITWYNRRWYEYTGTTPEQMEGWGWQAVHDPAALPEVLRLWREALATRQEFEMEFPLRGADGRYRRFLTRAFPLKDQVGKVVQWFGTNTDVTELVEAQEALREADRRKNEFLSMLSHELRNPLAPICNSVALLRRGERLDAHRARTAIDVIDRQAAQLSRLVDDLLDISRITRGKVRLSRKVVSLAEVVRRVETDHGDLFAGMGLALEHRGPDDPLWVDVDAARLAQVVGNLLQNAAKFTEPGGRVEVALGAEGGEAVLRVRDDGAGMDETTVARLFQPFMQAEVTLDRASGGLGLGLALAKALIEMHGGTIRAASAGVGRGSEFVVALPLAATPGARSAPPRLVEPHVHRRVVLIEDNPDGAETLRELLELEGHEVVLAHDGQQGLDVALGSDPDVVVCDLGIPSIDGYEVARRLRAHGSRARLVALTGYAAPEDVERAHQAGFDDHLAKPPDLDKLFAAVAR